MAFRRSIDTELLPDINKFAQFAEKEEHPIILVPVLEFFQLFAELAHTLEYPTRHHPNTGQDSQRKNPSRLARHQLHISQIMRRSAADDSLAVYDQVTAECQARLRFLFKRANHRTEFTGQPSIICIKKSEIFSSGHSDARVSSFGDTSITL